MIDAPDLPEAGDAALIVAVSNGDRAAFAALFGHYAPRIKAFLMRRGTSADKAEEMAQEAMLTVWRKGAQFDPARATAAAWIFAIARNLWIDQHRRARPTPAPDPALAPDPPPLADSVLGEVQRATRLREAIASLPPDQAEALRLAFFDGHTHSEIETMLGVSLGTVKSRLRLAMGRLRNALGDLA